MAEVGVYDPNRVIVTLDGYQVTGWAAGDDAIALERDADRSEAQVGVGGRVQMHRKHNRMHRLTLKLQHTSSDNDVLMTMQRRFHREGGSYRFPVSLSDLNAQETHSSEECWISDAPVVSAGENVSEREWVVHMPYHEVTRGEGGEFNGGIV